MGIVINRLRQRKSVAWLAEKPPDDASRILIEREYRVERYSDEELHDRKVLEGISAVVFAHRRGEPPSIETALRAHAKRLLDFGINIILRTNPDALPSIIEVINELKVPIGGVPLPDAEKLEAQKGQSGDPPIPCVQYYSEPASWAFIANFVSDNAVGPAPNSNLSIAVDLAPEEQQKVLTDSAKLLLQRAFWDCSGVHLSPITTGNSGVDVFRACAELSGGLHGQWPQPHFVKLGNRQKILSEYINYIGHVDPYIPFHLGPHLVTDRCCLGASDGILVGDYVEESEDLCDCAPEGRSAPAIACLFDRTLLGWHRRAHEVDISIAVGLLGRFPRRINAARMARARELGATQEIKALRTLFERCTSTPVLVGPIHGDLHSGNVRVRATDAIVIDFLQHCDNPLVFDAACLEASLLIEGFANDERPTQVWLESLRPLYDLPPLDQRTSQVKLQEPSFWFHASVLQIRRYARQWECKPNQYAGALALAMIIKAQKDPGASEPEASRRAGAYVIAERILLNTFGALTIQPAAPQPAIPATPER